MEMSIKEAAKQLKVESHVLRYWEDELGLEIKRNNMGHRYYTEQDIRMFREIQKLKQNGLSLKDIKAGIDKRRKDEPAKGEVESRPVNETADRSDDNSRDKDIKVVDFKLAQVQAAMNKIVANALRENKDIITTSIKSEITADVMRQFDAVMREKEEKEEARFRKLDEVLRQMQLANAEVAATKPRGLFRRNR